MAKASPKIFVREGAKVVAGDISGAEKDTASEVGDAVLPVHCDVTKEAEVEAMFAAALEEFGQVDAVLNVAGIGGPQPIHELTMEAFDETFDVNLRANTSPRCSRRQLSDAPASRPKWPRSRRSSRRTARRS